MAGKIVVIGASLGGLTALQSVLSALPRDFPAPVVIVQHRGAESGNALDSILRRSCALKVIEPQDKEAILPGTVYLAPPDYHLLIEGATFALSTEGVVSYARPSIDVLFDSAARAYARRVIGVVLTGANRDGARGSASIKRHGGYLIVQSPDEAECNVMPRAALAAVQADRILTLQEVGPRLVELCQEDRNG